MEKTEKSTIHTPAVTCCDVEAGATTGNPGENQRGHFGLVVDHSRTTPYARIATRRNPRSKWLKVRVTHPEHDDLKARAGMAGTALADYVRAQIAAIHVDLDVRAELASLRESLSKAKQVPTESLDRGAYTARTLTECLLILREVASARDAQILGRVRAQLHQLYKEQSK